MDGYLYIVNGDRRYLAEAARSVGSLRRVDPAAHVTLITDLAAAGAHADLLDPFDDVLVREGHGADDWKSALLYKSAVISETPYDRTFFVDSDTCFLASCRHLFDLLDAFDLLVCTAPAEGEIGRIDGTLREGLTPYNTGVLLWRRNGRTDALLSAWPLTYEAGFDVFPHDQPPFIEAVAVSGVTTYALPTVYNFRTPFFERAFGEVKILHGRGDLERLAGEINASHVNRAWLPTLGMCVWRDMRPAQWAKLLARASRAVGRLAISRSRARARTIRHLAARHVPS